MKNKFYALIVSLAFISNIAQAGEPDLKKACKGLSSLRETFLEVVKEKNRAERILKKAGIHLEEMKQMDAEIVRLKDEYNALAKVCRSAHASRTTFIAKLRGYEMMDFYKRLSEVIGEAGNLNYRALKIDEDLQTRFIKTAEILLAKAVETLSVILEKDPIKEVGAQFEMNKALNDQTLILIEMLGIDVSDVKDVDTLLEKMKERIQELTPEIDIL